MYLLHTYYYHKSYTVLPLCQHAVQEDRASAQCLISAAFSVSLFSTAPVLIFHGLQLLHRSTCSALEHLPLLNLVPSLTPLFPPPVPLWHFYFFLNIYFPEVPPSWLLGLALDCSGTVGSSWNPVHPTRSSPGLSLPLVSKHCHLHPKQLSGDFKCQPVWDL